ncbi:unnamed protein product [Caenorhabditis bovis]|uniref:Protein neuralized n=1 Tax=Caenorhabditis bovis TaxID=2654633 RepID=A0A8S1EF00_9PELO|nr:unnamed protein product [Caenorhabditis bovis]
MTEYRASSYVDDRDSPAPERSSNRFLDRSVSYSRYQPTRSAGSSYSNCTSVDELCNRFNRYQRQVRDIVNTFAESDIDETTRQIMNQNSFNRPPLAFHTVHGTNVVLLKNGRVARRKESFCKGLAFSNRPVDIDENVCLKLSEVSSNWSGVLRFGVTNFDPETYRNIPVPKFACPDLTSKEGYWAKALPERYSIEGNVLHFFINATGELYYGLNGSQKGLFLTGINVHLPMWLILDIYGNSVALEFLDANEFVVRRRDPIPPVPINRAPAVPPPVLPQNHLHARDNTQNERMDVRHSGSLIRFHHITGRNVVLNAARNEATRNDSEYHQGYVFTERPVRRSEKVTILIKSVEPLYSGGLAFGLTCCDPSTLVNSDLPDDSALLIDLPDYWVGIKDVAVKPAAGAKLSFWILQSGEVKFSMDDGEGRVIFYCDASLSLYMYFDVYGSTTSIRLLGSEQVAQNGRSIANVPAITSENPGTRSQPLSIPTRPRRAAPPLPAPRNSNSQSPMLRVNMPAVDQAPLVPPPPVAQRPEPRVPPYPPPPRPVVSRITDLDDLSSIPSVSGRAVPAVPLTRPAISNPPPVPPPKLPSNMPTASSSSTQQSDADKREDECTICMDAAVNCALYTCGHMCVCYPCGQAIMKTGEPTCPVCRAPIKDLLQIFRP